jgi:hypothetical protein
LEVFATEITVRTDFNDQFKLEKLRRFEFYCSSNIEIFEKILKPNSLYEIKISSPKVSATRENALSTNYWSVIPRILSKQEKSVSLELSECTITGFPDSPEVWALKNLLKLSLSSLKFPTPKDFEKFTKFIKSLDKLTDLSLKQLEDEDEGGIEDSDVESVDLDESEDSVDEDDSDAGENRNDFAEILTHLLFLPTLTKLSFNYFDWHQTEKIFNLKIQNPSVEDLTMKEVVVDETNSYSKYMEIFSNVRKAALINFAGSEDANLAPINKWPLLEELEVDELEEQMLFQIELKNLRCFKFNGVAYFNSASWKQFCLKHPHLQSTLRSHS